MRNYSKLTLSAAIATAVLSSCCNSARIEGSLPEAPDSKVIVKLLDINKYKTLDTVTTDDKGRYEYKLPLESGQPEFIYLFYKDTRIASLLLQKGDKVNVNSDTLGTFSVSGSDETDKLVEVEKAEAEFNDKFLAAAGRLDDLDPSSLEAVQLKKDIASQYVAYYRSRVKYILQNSHSLTSIPVLYQVVGNGLPVFGQTTDALHFRSICDSLKTIYPESKYVKALDEEATKREQLLSLNSRISNAEAAGFPDLELSDINGQKVKLSSLKSKIVMIYFWNPSDAAQKMFNQDEMKPIYEEFHDKGFDIYSVAVGPDKTTWASVVKGQKLPWINVCDSEGSSLNVYNVGSLPLVHFIIDGTISKVQGVKDGASLRKFLNSEL